MEIPAISDSLSYKISSQVRFSDKINPPFQESLLRYSTKLDQCNLIVTRIREERKQHDLLHKKMLFTTSQSSETRTLSPEETKDLQEYIIISRSFNFDNEDFFIHVQILLDRMTQVLGHFFEDVPSHTKLNFVSHRKYFVDSNDYSDVEYGNYIRDKTKWFPLMLSVIRNNLIVHDIITNWTGTKYSPKDNKHSLLRMRRLDENQSTKIISQLNKIKDSHKDDILDIQDKHNIWELLQGFDYNTDNLTHDEIRTLLQIHKEIGGELPDVEEVITKIQNLLDFVGSHIAKKELIPYKS